MKKKKKSLSNKQLLLLLLLFTQLVDEDNDPPMRSAQISFCLSLSFFLVLYKAPPLPESREKKERGRRKDTRKRQRITMKATIQYSEKKRRRLRKKQTKKKYSSTSRRSTLGVYFHQLHTPLPP